MWEALEVAQAARLRARHARRARGPHRAGRDERVGRPAPAPVDRPGADPQAGDLPVRRLVLGPRPGHRRPAAAPAAVHARRPRSSSSPSGCRRSSTADEILVLEDGDSSGTARTTSCSDLPDLRRDRAVPDRREETRHDASGNGNEHRRTIERASTLGDDAEIDPQRLVETGARAGRWNAGAASRWSARRSSASRCAGCSQVLGRERLGSSLVLVCAVGSVDAQRARPAHPRPRHRRHHPRRAQSADGIDFGDLHHRCSWRSRLYVGVGALQLCSRVHDRRASCSASMLHLRRAGRGQDPRPAAQLHRPPAARRPAQPGHQRPRQPRPEPAADAQPDADLGAAAHRRRGHDVHDLVAARPRRADHGAAVGLRHAHGRRPRPTEVPRPVAPARARSTRRSRRPSPATPSSRRSGASATSRNGSSDTTTRCTSRRSAPSSCRA